MQKGQNLFPFYTGGYTWKTYGAMNMMFWERHQHTSLESAQKLLAESHTQVLKKAAVYSNEALFTKKYYPWTGTTDLGSYFVSATASRYAWTIKKIQQHCKKYA